MNRYFLLLGTNMGNKLANLEAATRLISVQIGSIITKSSIYQTSAWGIENQDDFYNQVMIVDSKIAALEVLEACLDIEKKMGRVRLTKWGARLIDIDILYTGNLILRSAKLNVPHPEIQNRRFTLAPLAEIAPDYVHPVLRKSNYELLQLCQDSLEVFKIEHLN